MYLVTCKSFYLIAMKTVRLMACDDSFQANLIKGALENEGIPVILHNEHTSGVMRGYIREASTVDIFIDERDSERALELLERNQMIPERLNCCPYCHSDQITFVLKKKHRVRAILAGLLALLAASSPGTEHWEYVCKQCGARFDKPVGKEKKQ